MQRIAEAIALATLTFVPAAFGAEILVLSGGAAQAPLKAALPAFESRSGHAVKIDFAPAGAIAKRVAAGEVFDLICSAIPIFSSSCAK